MRKYTKDKSYKEERSVVEHQAIMPVSEEPVEEYEEAGGRDATSKYQKSEGYLDPKIFVVIFIGATKRESDYFKILTGRDSKKLFPKIKIQNWEYSYNPKKIFEEYVLPKYEEYKSSMSEDYPDSFYFVVDVDDFRKQLLEIKPQCEVINMNLIISNPCFEVWLYYSERGDKFDSFSYPITNNPQLSQNVKYWLGNESGIKGGVNPIKAIFNIKRNIENARKNYGVDFDGIPSLFSTNMFVLAEEILPYIEGGLERAKAINEGKKIKHINNK